jgi:hypothetical protein
MQPPYADGNGARSAKPLKIHGSARIWIQDRAIADPLGERFVL